MNHRKLIFASLIALPLSAGGLWLHAEEKPAPSPAPPVASPAKASVAEKESPKNVDGKSDRPDKGDKSDKSEKDRGDDRRSRGEWGGPRFGPPGGPGGSGGPGGPPPSANGTNQFNQFSADELRLMIESVQPKNSRLAEKMKERFADALAKKPTKLTPEQLEAVLSVFEDREPYLAGRIKESIKENPERVATMLAHHWPRLEKAIELKKSDRELYNAQSVEILKQGETRGLLYKLRKSLQEKNEAEATKLQDDIKAKLQEQHKARQTIRQLELARMNDKIKKLSEEITAEEAKSAQVIDKHFNDMLKWAQSRWERGDKGDREPGDKPSRPEHGDRPEKKDEK